MGATTPRVWLRVMTRTRFFDYWLHVVVIVLSASARGKGEGGPETAAARGKGGSADDERKEQSDADVVYPLEINSVADGASDDWGGCGDARNESEVETPSEEPMGLIAAEGEDGAGTDGSDAETEDEE